jgi:quercetin dioxygenase-like cupin family protein
MSIIPGTDRPAAVRPAPWPTLQRLVDRANGSEAVTVLVNRFTGDERVARHTHDVEEVLVVVAGAVTVSLGDDAFRVAAGDAVVVPSGTLHGLRHDGPGEASVVAILASPDVVIGSP